MSADGVLERRARMRSSLLVARVCVCGHQVATDRFAAPDVFLPAERAWQRTRRDAARLGAAVTL